MGTSGLKLISWNVNGLRAAIKKGFLDFLEDENPDVICLQEVKALPEQIEEEFKGYHLFWNPAEKKGYSGTAIFSKYKPINFSLGLGLDKHDNEGRVITLEFESWYLVTVYTPNSKRDLSRLYYRTQSWDKDFLAYVKNLEKSKPVVFCGDLNVAHQEIDLANPKTNTKNAGYTLEERESFDHIVSSGFIDTFREFHSEGDRYSWWSYMNQARPRNIGWRIDYFCVSASLKSQLKGADILDHIHGSDHCPVSLALSDDIEPRPC